MLERSKKTNLLEQRSYKYELHDVEKPNLYSEIYDYAEVPKVPFNHRRVPLGMADEIWITDTSFRDGQQSREPYTVGGNFLAVSSALPSRRGKGDYPSDRIFCLQQKGQGGDREMPVDGA